MLRALLGISALAALSLASDDPSSATYNFLTMADWGADDAGQYATAAGMGDVAAAIDAKFVFALGDNFYHTAKSHCSNSGICPDNADGIDVSAPIAESDAHGLTALAAHTALTPLSHRSHREPSASRARSRRSTRRRA